MATAGNQDQNRSTRNLYFFHLHMKLSDGPLGYGESSAFHPRHLKWCLVANDADDNPGLGGKRTVVKGSGVI